MFDITNRLIRHHHVYGNTALDLLCKLITNLLINEIMRGNVELEDLPNNMDKLKLVILGNIMRNLEFLKEKFNDKKH